MAHERHLTRSFSSSSDLALLSKLTVDQLSHCHVKDRRLQESENEKHDKHHIYDHAISIIHAHLREDHSISANSVLATHRTPDVFDKFLCVSI